LHFSWKLGLAYVILTLVRVRAFGKLRRE
jgi:hypothetical protein